MLISSLYYYGDAYILAKRTITFLRAGADKWQYKRVEIINKPDSKFMYLLLTV